ncbi:MAG: NAD-dependent protein deacylase [Zoogloeaceae bacterium]|jgi:NAD-dependent deacetylase|nr:NAD-dependent protein deacylase [Zoogloeaceae bacterium]
MSAPLDDSLLFTARKIAVLLDRAKRVLFITGAGISADSGLPTYRGLGGLYENDLTAEGIPIEEALSGEMLRRRPEITWKYMAQIEENCRHAGPNAAHELMAQWERELPYVMVLTQNIDGLHRAAGSENVVEIHGDLHRLRCMHCGLREAAQNLAGRALPPACPQCGKAMRPEVVLFGEMLPEAELGRLRTALETGFDLVFSIGTTSVFPYIAQPVSQAVRAGVPTVEINPGHTCLSAHVAYRLPMGAAAALTAIEAQRMSGGRAWRS